MKVSHNMGEKTFTIGDITFPCTDEEGIELLLYFKFPQDSDEEKAMGILKKNGVKLSSETE